jgi:uncharacterized protein YcbK (DUF882 family)
MLRLFLTALLGMSVTLVTPKAAYAFEPGSGLASARVNSKDAARPRRAKHRMVSRGKLQGWAVSDAELRSAPLDRPSGDLRIYSMAYDEELKTNIFNPDGSYSIDAARQIAHVFRCKRTGEEHEIDPRLITILSHVTDRYPGRRIELLSGYRFQRKTTSNHFKGMASDIRVEGIRPKDLRAFVSTLDAGGMGIGFYPRVGFVHVDVRPAPSFRWIDNSRSNPDSWDKQPPRAWKRHKLQS